MIEQDARKLTLGDARVIIGMLPSRVNRQAEYHHLGGEDGPNPYDITLDELDSLIGYAKQIRAEIQALRAHTHEWTPNSYCAICGADGLA